MQHRRRDGCHLRVLENFIALQTGQHRRRHGTYPCHVLRPLQRLDRRGHMRHDADTFQGVTQGLDPCRGPFGQLAQVEPLIGGETDGACWEHFGH